MMEEVIGQLSNTGSDREGRRRHGCSCVWERSRVGPLNAGKNATIVQWGVAAMTRQRTESRCQFRRILKPPKRRLLVGKPKFTQISPL